jgi:ribosome-associated protein
MKSNVRNTDFSNDWYFITSRSSGKGGQHVNKVSTKAELRFNIDESGLLTDEEKERIFKKLKNKINKYGELIISSENERSQLLNKRRAIEKFYDLLEKALKKRKRRLFTKKPQKADEKRLKEKKRHSEKKKLRSKDDIN